MQDNTSGVEISTPEVFILHFQLLYVYHSPITHASIFLSTIHLLYNFLLLTTSQWKIHCMVVVTRRSPPIELAPMYYVYMITIIYSPHAFLDCVGILEVLG